MIYCISCERYPKNAKTLPSGSSFEDELYTVKLISKDKPSSLALSGEDVEGLPDDVEFAVGSKLYVVSGDNGSEVYVYIDDAFEQWDSSINID